MKAAAFNLRGTNGTGKTYVAREILRLTRALPAKMVNRRKPLYYTGSYHRAPIHILGSYETACGGCDTIPSVKIVADILHELLSGPRCLVFYEGLMISHMIGTVGAAAKLHNDRHLMGFLDTPLETCIQRVLVRRKARGDDRPFDPNRTLVGDYRAVKMAKANAERQGFKVVEVNHKHAVSDVLRFLDSL